MNDFNPYFWSHPEKWDEIRKDIDSNGICRETEDPTLEPLTKNAITVCIYRITFICLCITSYIIFFLFNELLIARTIAAIVTFVTLLDLITTYLISKFYKE